MTAGYVYVLANSSMPNLVKVGLTTRHPQDRANELSGATGVPVPFMVVYHQSVRDCVTAEKFVHAALQAKGFRVSEHREFFAASIPDVIACILTLPAELITSEVVESSNVGDTDCDDTSSNPELPWLDLWHEAEDLNFGTADSLENPILAKERYQQALNLGCYMSYARLGQLAATGRCGRKDNAAAKHYFHQGTSNGDYVSYLHLLHVYLDEQDPVSAKKCLQLFFQSRGNGALHGLEKTFLVGAELAGLVAFKRELFVDLRESALAQLEAMKSELLEALELDIARWRRDTRPGSGAVVGRLQAARDWIDTLHSGSAEA